MGILREKRIGLNKLFLNSRFLKSQSITNGLYVTNEVRSPRVSITARADPISGMQWRLRKGSKLLHYTAHGFFNLHIKAKVKHEIDASESRRRLLQAQGHRGTKDSLRGAE
jgi:hypothetical protein